MVARAVLLRPKLIVADEPVSMVDASLRATILEALRTLHEELGISIVYITHDLATAYQISDTILVMYRAAVVEAGAIAPIVERPRHPYTQLLIASIPRVSTERTWLGQGNGAAAGVVAGGGCSFMLIAVRWRWARAATPFLRCTGQTLRGQLPAFGIRRPRNWPRLILAMCWRAVSDRRSGLRGRLDNADRYHARRLNRRAM